MQFRTTIKLNHAPELADVMTMTHTVMTSTNNSAVQVQFDHSSELFLVNMEVSALNWRGRKPRIVTEAGRPYSDVNKSERKSRDTVYNYICGTGRWQSTILQRLT